MQTSRSQTVTHISDALIRVLAPNPSPMTFWGTNCYILGTGSERVLIDCGPNTPQHLQAILGALPNQTRISHILITHAHTDHSGGAAQMSKLAQAPVYAFGTATSGRSAQMVQLVGAEDMGGGEGIDDSFHPDITLKHGETIMTPAGDITALHTPGHMANHLSFAWNDLLFSGDLIMGWSSSLISPPDGDVADFRKSCDMLLARPNTRLMPGHGDFVTDGHARIHQLVQHRAMREQMILKGLEQATSPATALTISQITKAAYIDLDPRALPAASRNTFAHLIDLTYRKIISATPKLSQAAKFHTRIPQ